MLARGVDVIGMVWRIGKAVRRAGHPHDVIDKGGGPREVLVLGRRKDAALVVVLAGPALLRRAQWQPQPPVFADPLPQPLGAFVVDRQFLLGQYDRLAERAPFAQ